MIARLHALWLRFARSNFAAALVAVLMLHLGGFAYMAIFMTGLMQYGLLGAALESTLYLFLVLGVLAALRRVRLAVQQGEAVRAAELGGQGGAADV